MRSIIKELSAFAPGFLTLVLVGFVIVLVSCRDMRADESFDELSPTLVPSSHPPGTLLRDSRGGFWMVVAWPERAPIAPGELARARLTPEDAIPMSSAESLCLRNRGWLWQPQERWNFIRYMPERTYWYVDFQRKLRREVTMPVMLAWRENPDSAPVWSGTETEWSEEYRDLEPMTFPDGTLIHTEHGYALFFDGASHPFASEALARAAGYHLSRAIELSESQMYAYGAVEEPLTAQVFTVCPLAMSQARSADDEDGDGSPRAHDCDDHNAGRAPHLIETCDGIDNNCDGIVDDGFAVGLPCHLDDGCHSPGITACRADGWSVSCQNDDALCE